jgi:peptidoglycan hydrolase-like protein with peptidoglycan-binding domain
VVQEELRRRHFFYGDIDGRESPELTNALKLYQERKGFRQTGVADSETLRSLSISREHGADLPDVPVLRSDLAPSAANQGGADGVAPLAATSGSSGDVLPTNMEMRAYLREYLDAAQQANVADEMRFYAPQVSYYDQGAVTKTYIRNELVTYRQHWAERRYTLDDPITVTARGDSVQVRYRVGFALVNSELGRKAAGVTNNVLLLTRGSDQRWEIASIQEERVRHAARRRTKSRSGDPVGRTMHKVGQSVRKLFR